MVKYEEDSVYSHNYGQTAYSLYLHYILELNKKKHNSFKLYFCQLNISDIFIFYYFCRCYLDPFTVCYGGNEYDFPLFM